MQPNATDPTPLHPLCRQLPALDLDGLERLEAFVRAQFIADPAQLDATFARLEAVFEQIDGHTHEVGREVRRPSDVDVGPLLAVDPLLAAYDPFAHVTEDLFKTGPGFVVLLNWPLTTLAERDAEGPKYSRRQWAEARLAGRFARRVPGEVRQAVTRASAEADRYVSQYNLWMHHLVDETGARPFPPGLRLISHWNLRDELKGRYGDPEGLKKQRMIIKVMERIVTQTIPAAVIDDPRVDWDPFSNKVSAAPADTIEADAPRRGAAPVLTGAPEPDARYEKLLAQFHAARREDPYAPTAPTAPTLLAASLQGLTSIRLTWTDNATDEAGFHVERSPAGAGTWVRIASPLANDEDFVDGGLPYATSWDYRVQDLDAVAMLETIREYALERLRSSGEAELTAEIASTSPFHR